MRIRLKGSTGMTTEMLWTPTVCLWVPMGVTPCRSKPTYTIRMIVTKDFLANCLPSGCNNKTYCSPSCAGHELVCTPLINGLRKLSNVYVENSNKETIEPEEEGTLGTDTLGWAAAVRVSAESGRACISVGSAPSAMSRN